MNFTTYIYFLIITRIGLSIKNIPVIGKFPSLLSAERSQRRAGIKNARFRNDYLHSWRIKAPGTLSGGTTEEHPGSPSTSSRANPCIMERSNRGHRSSEGALLASPRRATPHHHHHHRRAVSILPSLWPFTHPLGRRGYYIFDHRLAYEDVSRTYSNALP